MANIYIVESPLQFLNALEARHRFPGGKHILMVRKSVARYPRQEVQMRRLLEMFPEEWNRILSFAGEDWPHDDVKRSLYFLLRLLPQRYEKVFIGDPRSFIQRFLGLNLRAEQLLVLDDGVQSISMHEWAQPLSIPLTGMVSPRRKLIRMFQLLPGIHLQASEPLNLFTCFSLRPHLRQTIIQNDYAYLRSYVKGRKPEDSDAVYVLGTPMEEYDFASKKSARQLLRWIAERWRSQRIIYVAHRRESEEKLARIRADYGFEVVTFDLPVEAAFLEQGLYPLHIVSFYSSALFTLQHIYQRSSITALRVPPTWLHPAHRERLGALYTYMEQFSSIDVVDYADADASEAL